MSHLRYRKNINCLTSEQLHDLREALAALYELPASDEHSFAKIAGLHGSPSPSYCIHGYPGFLTWHRAYMEEFEKALQCIHSDVMLPFWDWSSGPTTGVPQACAEPTYVNRDGDTVPNPLYAGPLPPAAGGGQSNRRSNIDSTAFDDLASGAQSALTSGTFNTFQSALNGVHGGVHVRVGGHMASVPYASFDPIFYLHHANVDRLWAEWQKTHPGPLPANEASLELDPFNKPYSTEWHTGADFATTEMLGYRYTNFCLIIPPIIIGKAVDLLELDPDWVHRRLSRARLALRSEKMPVRSAEIRAFINQPRATERSKTIGNQRFAGSVGLFGMGPEEDPDLRMVQRQQTFDVTLDVTDTLKEMSADAESLTLLLLAVDADGELLSSEEVEVDEIELLAE